MPAPQGDEGREQFARDAHVVTSIAGMLGFGELSRCCADLLALPSDDATGLDAASQAVMMAKDATSRRVIAMIGERLAPPRGDQERQRFAASTR